ncbi:MAG: hypothetical protein JW768_12450 [Chitinispirillaceae bacterium]|nr:hypothetical protein [Chitinispirillaceae bacterium]
MKNHLAITRYLCGNILCMLLLQIVHVHASSTAPTMDSIYYFFQRTVYLETLEQNGAWWASPARMSAARATSVFTSNTGLLGGKYSISSVRVLFPIYDSTTAGIGLTGASTRETRSFTGDQSGGHFSSNFNFSRPSLEAAISYSPPFGGTIGILGVTGTESILPHATSTIPRYYFIWGMGIGLLSPSLFSTVQFSLTTLSVCHYQIDAWWDHGVKTGMLLEVSDGLVRGSLEYGFSLKNGFYLPSGRDDNYAYEVIKGTASLRFRSIAGFILGFSRDSRNFRDNGSTLHTGLELRPSKVYPYWGGYEMGASLNATRFERDDSRALSLIHRFWAGYTFSKKITTP